MGAAIPPHDAPELLHPQETGAAGACQPSAPEPRRLRPHEIPHPTLAADTDPAAERVQLAIYRDMTPARKLQLVLEGIHLSRDLALTGLRARHPAAKPDELRRRLYSLELGEELATKVYGLLRRAMTPSLWAVPLQVIAVLENLGVRHHVGGSFASSIHGVPRQTRDLDLVAELMPGHVATFAARLQADFYLDEKAMRRAIERRSHFNLVHHATGFKVDLFVSGAGAFDRAEMERATPYPLGEDPPRSVLIKSAEDTLLRKLAWYRLGGEISDRQWTDILGIVQTQAGRLDLSYLRAWATPLDVADLLDRALSPEDSGR